MLNHKNGTILHPALNVPLNVWWIINNSSFVSQSCFTAKNFLGFEVGFEPSSLFSADQSRLHNGDLGKWHQLTSQLVKSGLNNTTLFKLWGVN